MKAAFHVAQTDVPDAVVTSFPVSFCVEAQHPTGFNSHLYAGFSRGELLATRCPVCASTNFPPRRRCSEPVCAGSSVSTEWYALPGTGTVVAETLVHSPPPYADVAIPYRVALIDLDAVDGRLLHRIEGDVGVGGRVRAKFTTDEAFHPLHMFHFCPEAPQP